jgi:glycosyltransferase involved in cell wall biosynthesis
MKVAVIHDDLMRRGGAEQVVLSMLKAFPNADLYTLCYRPNLTYEEFEKFKIYTSLFQYLVKTEKMMKRFFFPIGILCMKLLKIKGYDLVLISSTFCAKYASIDRHSKVFIYTHTPFRLAWDPESYKEFAESYGIKRFIFNYIIRVLQYVDMSAAQKGNYHISITTETADRVKTAYCISEVSVINPPVKSNNFFINKQSEKKYYLVVSRLEYYKKVDLAIEVFNELNIPLIIVGNGSKKDELMNLANNNIQFKSNVSGSELSSIYADCKALIFPQYEDFGITPLEANCSGRPVIAYAKGGILETMVPYNEKNKKFTSVFFYKQDKNSLINAIKLIENLEIDTDFIKEHSMKFDEIVFIEKLTTFIKSRL